MQDNTGNQVGGKLGEFAYWPKEGGNMAGRPVSEVLKDIISNVQEIIRAEVRLAKTEIKEETGKAWTGARMLLIAGIVGLYGAGFVLLGIVYALSGLMPPWLAALGMGLVLSIVAYVLLNKGRSELKHVSPKPEKAIQNVKENVEWMKDQVKS
jgi:uncharacterized membrane protein YqjE